MQSTSLPSSQHRKKSVFGGLLTTALLLLLSLLIAANRQYIYDTVRFWTYQPSSEVAAIAKRAELSDAGLFTFYAAHPEVDGSQTFNSKCDRKEQNTAVIGCYVNDQIYVYNVTDARLDGIKEVTAAHEMLHAVYQRLSDADREKVNKLVEAEYAKLSQDPAFSERMAFYARTEPGERDNELHSIIGTEIRSVSPELEAHYAKYFSHRSDLLNLYDSYSQEFKELDERSKTLSSEIETLRKKIDTDKAGYESESNVLSQAVADFKQRAASGNFTSQAVFNSEKSALQARIDSLNSYRQSIINEINQLTALVNEYNDIATKSQDLYKSIDSTLAPAPKV